MFKLRHWIVLLIIIVPLLASCNGEDNVEELPTLVIIPTELPTATDTATFTPTATPTFTATPIPTDTATFTPTATVTSSMTFTPSVTPSSTPLPATATSTLTPIPSATDTPTLTSTPDLPQIMSFTSSGQTIAGGSSVTLSWESNADTAQIQELNEQGAVVQTFSVTPSGQLPITVPNTTGQIIYKLTVFRTGQQDTRSIGIQVQLTCGIPWFFGNQYAPDGAGCPLTMQVSSVGKYQPFERGIMFNAIVNGENRVYGLDVASRRYMVYTNLWDGATVHTSSCGTAPPGLFDPQDVFSWMYHVNLGTNGYWCNPNGGIGWAAAAADLANSQLTQFEAQGVAFYIIIPGYGTVRISGEPVTGTWERLPIP